MQSLHKVTLTFVAIHYRTTCFKEHNNHIQQEILFIELFFATSPLPHPSHHITEGEDDGLSKLCERIKSGEDSLASNTVDVEAESSIAEVVIDSSRAESRGRFCRFFNSVVS